MKILVSNDDGFQSQGIRALRTALATVADVTVVAPDRNRSGASNSLTLDVPLRFRNAPTRLMKNLGFGRGYRYAHDEPDAFATGERYLPDEMPDRRYYRPVPRGLEQRIAEALARLRTRTPPGDKSSE